MAFKVKSREENNEFNKEIKRVALVKKETYLGESNTHVYVRQVVWKGTSFNKDGSKRDKTRSINMLPCGFTFICLQQEQYNTVIFFSHKEKIISTFILKRNNWEGRKQK